MTPDRWYVLAGNQSGTILEVRIVAGPLTLDAAKEEAHHRLKRAWEGITFSVVEFDPMYALT